MSASSPMQNPAPADGERIIDSKSSGFSLGLNGLVERRELLWIFLKRAISVRYRQMLLGILWSVLEPLALLGLMTLVFGTLLRVETSGYPYAVFAFAGLIPWLAFSKATMAAANSLVENMGLMSKVHFPRLILPVTGALRELFDSIVIFIVLVIFVAAYGYLPGTRLLLAPLLFLMTGLSALAIGLWLACIMVPLRDIRPLLGLVLQAGLYATPILYPATLVPSWLLPYYQLNPTYWVVELFRWMLLGKPVLIEASFYASIALVIVTLFAGLAIFGAAEKRIVDVQ